MSADVDDGEIAERLLALLRDRTGRRALAYAVRPERIPGGFDTRIVAFTLRDAPAELAGPLVLRLHRHDTDPANARFEAVVHRAIAGLGYPCPPVVLEGGLAAGLGGSFVVMPRVPGRVMLETLTSPMVVRFPAILAGLQLALHGLDAAALRDALAAADIDPARCSVDAELAAFDRAITTARLDDLGATFAWLVAHRPPDPGTLAICHGDLHPLNILVEDGRPTGVIDWSASHLRFADPAYDVGATIALLRHGPLAVPRGLGTLAALGRLWLVDAYRRSYLRGRRLEPGRVRYYEALRTLGFLIEGLVYRPASAGVVAASTKPSAFADPRVIARAARRLHALTGVGPAGH